jgi:hypothetical protein
MVSIATSLGLRAAICGIKVDRAAATLPATTNTAYFTIAGGRVILTGLLGEVTTIVQAQANAAKWIATPTVGTATDICGTLDLNAAEVGCLLSITGLASDAMRGVVSSSGSVSGMTRLVYLATGTLRFSTAATNTGATKWTAFWLPVDDGATLVAA